MISLNVGNLWSSTYLDKVIELNKQYGDTVRVDSLFGSIAGLTPTARAADRIPYRDWNFLDHYIDKARKNNIKIRYTLNTSCLGSIQTFKHDWDSKLKADIQELHSIGVNEWTVTSALLIQLLREMFPSDFIEVSTIYEMTSPLEADHLMRLGANGVNLSTSINRRPSAIEHIMKTGIRVSVLANEACLFGCPWRRECYNLSSHDSQRSEELFGNYPFAYCNNYRMENPVEWVKSRMVLPSWMSLYQEKFGIKCFKVAYRTHPYDVAIPILEYYMSQHDPTNLLDLWPTIAKLGGTEEPRDSCFISTAVVKDELSALLSAGEHCGSKTCGVYGNGCRVCHKLYDRAYKEKGL